jgi:hypothetical protein
MGDDKERPEQMFAPSVTTPNFEPTTKPSRSDGETSMVTTTAVPVPLEMLQKIVDFCAQTL